MKKIITCVAKAQIIALLLLSAHFSFAQGNRTANNQSPVNTGKFGNDVIINPDPTINQRDVKVAVAFNGWIYAAYTTVDVTANAGGITIEVSKDNGATWVIIDSYNPTNVRYEDVDITVAGLSVSTIVVYVVGIRHNLGGNYVLFLDEYNGDTGAYIDSPFSKTSTNRFYWCLK